jgi:hypothetical protein
MVDALTDDVERDARLSLKRSLDIAGASITSK